MKQFGLIGYPLSHSFSKGYFSEKFQKESIFDCQYDIFPLEKIEDFVELCAQHKNIVGLNVTIPYKEKIIPFLDELDDEAKAIGAVNTIKFTNGKMIGYNTDCFGFEMSLKPLLKAHHSSALILGTGGASKAVEYVLKKLGISFQYVSRTKSSTSISYNDVNSFIIQHSTLIINSTPIGMYPNVDIAPNIPYDAITNQHLLYDLIYNPAETQFLTEGKIRGAQTKNGLEMLYLQAERSWEIWNS
ncbi:MAG TPA: shikimate dehydrogenase [Chitinophagales bacterium]|nr:shikimate dehydrogenase [Chitinophagales bacterium]